jgi:hypothetical protein
MTALREIALGKAQAVGRDAISQYIHLKGLVRARHQSADGAWLEMIPVDGTVKAVVKYDPAIPGAEAWATRISEAAPGLWAEVEQGRARRREMAR